MRHLFTLTVSALLLAAGAAQAVEETNQTMPTVTVAMQDAAQKSVGVVKLVEGPNGLLADIALEGVSSGWHAIHIHEDGDCSAKDFASAGAHAGHDHAHGFMTEGGMHPGDMPNVWAYSDGTVQAQAFLPGRKLADFEDEDGAAIILHAGSDDYASQPSGNAGDRIACGSL